MYFSRNSRYVLQRVRFLSPTFISSSRKNLSVKKPKDDPTKPPLRLNVPEDSPQSDSYTKLLQGSPRSNESRSRSLITRSKSIPFRSSSADNNLVKSESERQFSPVRINDFIIKTNDEDEPEKSYGKSQNEEDFSRGSINDGMSEQTLGEHFYDASSSTQNYCSKSPSEASTSEVPAQGQEESNASSKSLYIIIDIPPRNNEKHVSNLPDAEGSEEGKDDVYDSARLSSSGSAQEKPLLKRSKSFSRINCDKSKLKLSKKIEVHEIEDAATYVFHLKLTPNSWRKPCGVGWVPEKELSMRSQNFSTSDPPIKVRHSFASRGGMRKESFPADELPKLVRYEDGKEKQKSSELEEKEGLSADKVQPPAEPQPKATDWPLEKSAEEVVSVMQPDDLVEQVSYNKKERKSPRKFEQDDFGAVKSVTKTYPFRLPLKNREAKQEDSSPLESSSDVSKDDEPSVPAAEETVAPKADDAAPAAIAANKSSLNINEKKHFPKAAQPETVQPVARKETMFDGNYISDTYAQYVTKRHPKIAEKSNRKSAKYLSIYDSDYETQSWNEDVECRDRSEKNLFEINREKQEEFIPYEKLASAEEARNTAGVERKKTNSEPNISLTDLSEPKSKKTNNYFPQKIKPGKKKLTDNSYEKKSNIRNSKNSDFKKDENDGTTFKTSPSFLSIGCDKIPSSAMTYCAAFPPLLREALNARLRIRKDHLLNPKWTKIEIRPRGASAKCSQKYKVSELSENSILFPKSEGDKFDCDSLLCGKEETILNVIKNPEEESSPRISDNVANFANETLTNEQEQPSVDSLTMMKKVKEIVQLDLDNAVKLFRNGAYESSQELPSVVVLNEGSWEVDQDELKQQEEIKKSKMSTTSQFDSSLDCFRLTQDFLGDKIETNLPKYLPPKEERRVEMKLTTNELDSVITYNSKTNAFFINKKALVEAIRRRTKESREEINKTLNFLAKNTKNSLDIKTGDSILVFDEETQSWRVDFSILERREQELELEKELTKRSELILETFEKLEKGQMSTVPKPGSKDKKTFDYATEKWKVYEENKKAKSTKSKSPFKESNAEEIRRKNSDLYEDLFVANKKETTMSKAKKSAPGLDSSKTTKESKSSSGEKKELSGSSRRSGSGSPEDPDSPKSDSRTPPEKQRKSTDKDDNFWESFLNMNILPRDVRELPKPIPPSKMPPSPPPGPKTPGGSAPKIEEPKPRTPEKKIEEPKFKFPFKKHDETKLKIPEKKRDETKLKIPEKKRDESKLKTPEKKRDDTQIKIPESKVEEPLFKIHLPFIRDRKSDTPKTTDTKEEPKKKIEKGGSLPPVKGEKKTPPLSGLISNIKEKIEKKAPSPSEPSPGKKEKDKKGPPSREVTSEKKEKLEKKSPPSTPPTLTPKTDSPDHKKKPPTIGSSKPSTPTGAPPSKTPPTKPSPKGKNEKTACAADHYVSDTIIEMSKNKFKDTQTKIKAPKVETVKLNLTADTRLPSKITEINLSKKTEEMAKDRGDGPQNSMAARNPADDGLMKGNPSEPHRPLYKNLEKYKTHFIDPEYEENSMKIKSDIESNPNLNKLDNWNKTLVLHDIMKPPDNIESWLKDETDKMATLLLKILQETTDGKPKKKASQNKSKSDDKNLRGNPYETIRKKKEPENFLFRVRTVNLSLDNNKKSKPDVKVTLKPERRKDIPLQPDKNAKGLSVEDAGKLFTVERASLPPPSSPGGKGGQFPANYDATKPKSSESALEAVVYPVVLNRDFGQQNKLPLEITEEIPGPEILKKISQAWKVFPILGSQMTVFTLLRVFQLVNLGSSIIGQSGVDKSRRSAFMKLFAKHGPIVNVPGPLSGNVILIYKPEHVSAVFEQDATIPVRSVFDSLEYSRKDLEEQMYSANFSIDWTKPEWNDLRKGTNDPLFRGCEKYFMNLEMAGDSLISNIRKNKNSQNLVSEDFMDEIRKWSLEGLCSVLFEKSFGFLESRMSTSWIMEPDKLYMAIDKATQCLSKCERGFQSWRLVKTRPMTGLTQSYRSLSSIISKQVYQAEMNLKNKNELLKDGILFPLRELSFIESMLLNDGMTTEEVNCNLIDILLIGTNAVNSAMGFLLYSLAQNVKTQNKLLKELKEAFPYKSSRLDLKKLHSLKYLQACLKESLRLHLPVPIFYKMLQNDVLLSNYIIPKGTYVVMDFRVSCMKEQIFDDPDKFLPERWLGDEKWSHPFSSFPFCHGPKADLIKKVAEIQLLTCAAKIIRNFQVEYHFGEIKGTNSLMKFPDKPLKLNFIERKS